MIYTNSPDCRLLLVTIRDHLGHDAIRVLQIRGYTPSEAAVQAAHICVTLEMQGRGCRVLSVQEITAGTPFTVFPIPTEERNPWWQVR